MDVLVIVDCTFSLRNNYIKLLWLIILNSISFFYLNSFNFLISTLYLKLLKKCFLLQQLVLVITVFFLLVCVWQPWMRFNKYYFRFWFFFAYVKIGFLFWVAGLFVNRFNTFVIDFFYRVADNKTYLILFILTSCTKGFRNILLLIKLPLVFIDLVTLL